MANSTTLQAVLWELPKAPKRTYVPDWRINVLAKDDDFHCVVLAAAGQGYASIQQQTGLTRGKISNRLKAAKKLMGIDRWGNGLIRDYRNGRSIFATLIIETVARRVSSELTGELTTNTIDA
jgi:hypothetical protein